MRIIYDVLLNYNKYAYEFYEWNKNDNIKHFKSINSYKVSKKVLCDFINHKFKLNNNEFGKMCIFYDDYRACAFEFDKNGIVKGKSYMLFDEEEDVLNSNDSIININYEIIKKQIHNKYYTRKTQSDVNLLKKIFKNMDNESLIKYVYYECFDIKESNIKKAYNKLLSHINSNDIKLINKLIKLFHSKKRYKILKNR